MRVGVSLTFFFVLGTLLLLLGCLFQAQYEGFYLAFLYLVLLCLDVSSLGGMFIFAGKWRGSESGGDERWEGDREGGDRETVVKVYCIKKEFFSMQKN